VRQFDKAAQAARRWSSFDIDPSDCRQALLELPSLNVPCGFTDNGLPTSFQLIGRPDRKADSLRIGHTCQQIGD